MSFLKRSAFALVASAAFAMPAMAQTSFTYTTRGCFYTSPACTVSGTNPVGSNADADFNNEVKFTGVTDLVSAVSNANGYVSLTDLGTFSFNYGNISNGSIYTLPSNLNFKLWIDITSPAVNNDPYTFTAEIDGYLKESSTLGQLYVNFSNAVVYGTYPPTGMFKLTVDDRITGDYGDFNGDDNGWKSGLTLKGNIQCLVEEKGKYSQQSYGGGDDDNHDDHDNGPKYENGACDPGETTGGGVGDNVVPEPSTYALMAAGLFGVGIAARRRRKV